MKDKYLAYILAFSKISILSICNDLQVNRSNVLNGKASEETIKKVYDELIRRLEEISPKD